MPARPDSPHPDGTPTAPGPTDPDGPLTAGSTDAHDGRTALGGAHAEDDPGTASSSHDAGLMALVLAVDDELAAVAVDGALLRVSELAPAGQSCMWTPLDGAHPLELLLGFRAPLHWRALGVSCPGRSHPLDEYGARSRPDAEGAPVTVTLLVDRRGAAASVVRSGPAVTPMPGRTDGVVADACRRALGVPTAPPPSSTLGLWALAWLDRVVDAASRADASRRLRAWPQVAELHPAVGPLGGHTSGLAGPAALARAARALAEDWPWARLREHAATASTPGHPPSPELSAWMDEGMWARWLLSRLPAPEDVLAAVRALLPARLAEDVVAVANAGLDAP
jgi:hypothetical protein